MRPVRRLLVLNGVLLAGVAGASLAVQVADRGPAQVDASVRRYATAVSTSNLDAALAEIAPPERARWRDWIAGQLGNVYEVRGVAVRAPSLVDRALRHADGAPSEVSVALDVNRGYPDEFYQPTTRLPVEQVDGRWYLAEPLLAPEADQPLADLL
jgi:hypothetical protein